MKAMTNKELIKRYFVRKTTGDEESYGFSIKPRLKKGVSHLFLFSKESQFPIASKIIFNYFLLHPSKNRHSKLVIGIAKGLGVDFMFSPHADKTKFQKYMEEEINNNLFCLSQVMNDYQQNRLDRELTSASKYKKLMCNIHTLLNGEIRLELPKNQISLLDLNEVQDLWCWLIKENPNKKDRELLRKMYMLSRLLAS